jgi:hypothetical protein
MVCCGRRRNTPDRLSNRGYFRLKRGTGGCGTSCVAAYPIAAVKAFKGNATYGDDDYVDEYSVKSFDDQLQVSAKRIQQPIKSTMHFCPLH